MVVVLPHLAKAGIAALAQCRLSSSTIMRGRTRSRATELSRHGRGALALDDATRGHGDRGRKRRLGEHGGTEIAGTQLVSRTARDAFGASVSHDWKRDGLEITLLLPLDLLTR